MFSESDRKDIPKEAIQAFQTVLSFLDSSVVGIYLFGSAIVGGLRPNSDVDVLALELLCADGSLFITFTPSSPGLSQNSKHSRHHQAARK